MESDRVQALIEKAANREEERQANDLIDSQIKVLSAAYDKAAAYTNLIILAAYAGFFGLWQLAKEHISKPQALWAALLMLLSIVVFVLFEVWKMYFSSRGLLRLSRILTDPYNQRSIQKLVTAIEQHNAQERRRVIALGYVWHAVLGVTVLSGLAAVGVLAWAFVEGLLMP